MSDLNSDGYRFSRWRRMLWPIHRQELRKLIPLLLLFFLVSFDYNILRTMKDTLVVTAKASGAEVIPFIKVWVMFPGAVLMTYLFTRLSNRFSRETVFYSIFILFLGFFFLFAFLLYPNREILHPNEFADKLQMILPAGCKGLIAMLRNWTFTMFYVMAELWSNIVFFVLVWGYTNQVTSIHEAKRFYGVLGFAANFSGIVAGQISVYYSGQAFNAFLPFGTTAWEQSMTILLTLVIIAGILSLGIFRKLHGILQNDPRFFNPQDAAEQKSVKGKLSLRENFSFLFRSKYLIYITIIVIAYNVVINLVEVIWKDQLRELYPNPGDFNRYFNQVATLIGIVSTFAALFVSGNAIRKCGWTFTAMLTPLILCVTSVGFFGVYFYKEHLGIVAHALFGMTPLALIVFLGSMQNILSRGAKYSVFDATKEMAFVPLPVESKLKGKAAIDGICNRFGKSGGSVIHQTLLLTFASFAASAPYVAAILFLIIGGWMAAARLLGKEYNQLTGTVTPEPRFAKESSLGTAA